MKTTTKTTQTPVNKKFDDWMVSHWRPLMAYTYMIICIFDFILGPIMFVGFAAATTSTLIPWVPLTMDSGGLFHLAMGAILGVSAWTRGVEKVERTRQRIGFDEYDRRSDVKHDQLDDTFDVDDDPFKNAR
jgi:membrane protein implicated in regulation of membrane protease activity